MFRRFTSIWLVLALPLVAAAQSVLTANYDNSRTNSNLAETILTPGNVGPSSFGKLFTLSVDGEIYAQPLFVPGVSMSAGGATHNVVFVATLHNSIYAFDADTPATPLWTVNLGPSIPATTFNTSDGPYTDIEKEVGILGTPVIDGSTGTLYAVAGTLENGKVIYRLHALDVTSGVEKFGAPTQITGHVTGVGDNSANGIVTFDPAQHIQRAGLALSQGIVYAGFGSHADSTPFHGWLFAFSATNVQNQVAVFTPTPNGSGGAFWQSGRAPAIDSAGNLIAVSSNGDTDGVTNFSDSVLRLSARSLSLMDWFAPSDVQTLNDTDDDLGALGAILVPNTNYLVTGGKPGVVYLLDQTHLGNLNSTDAQIPQKFQPVGFGIFNAALWSRPDGVSLYVHGVNSPVQSFAFGSKSFGTQPVSQSIAWYGVPFQGMAISANGGQHGTGVLWVTTADSYPLPSKGTLRAYNADDLTSELWNSGMNSGDALGKFVKFVNPTVANGKVYVPSGSNQLVVYGLVTGNNPAPVITGITNAASYAAGPIAPGELVTIFGQNLGSGGPGVWTADGTLEEQIGGVNVSFNGIAAPILFSGPGQANVVTPFEIAGSGSVSIQIDVNGVTSAVQTVPVAVAAPGIFALDASGSGPGAILNVDYSVNSASNPAPAGSIVMIYATGGGLTTGLNAANRAAPAAASLAQQASVTVGGEPAKVLYAGAAPFEVNGMVQVNAQLPADVTGTVPVVLTVGAVSSPATITVAIK